MRNLLILFFSIMLFLTSCAKNNNTPSPNSTSSLENTSSDESINNMDNFHKGQTKTFNVDNSPIKICEEQSNIKILEDIKSILKNEIKLNENEIETIDVHKSIYEVRLGKMPDGFQRQLIVFSDSKTFMFLSKWDYSNITYINNVDDFKVNLSKLEFNMHDNILEVTTNMAFNDSCIHHTLQWNGIKLKLVESTETDKTEEFFAKRKALIEENNLNSIIELHGDYDTIELPSAYEEFYSQPKDIIRLAINDAQEFIKQEEYFKAYFILDFAINIYSEVWFDEDINNIPEFINNENYIETNINVIPNNELISILTTHSNLCSKIGLNDEHDKLTSIINDITKTMQED